MIENPNVIPIAVVVAVGIFLIKEILEAIRRSREKARKLDAVRRLLAIECERNKFAISRLRSQIEETEDARKAEREISINARITGPRLVIATDSGEVSAPIPLIHSTTLEKYLFDAASLNKTLFSLMEATAEGLIDAAHIRDGLIQYVSEDRQHLDGFADYAIKRLDKALEHVEALYFNSTTEPLAQGRVR